MIGSKSDDLPTLSPQISAPRPGILAETLTEQRAKMRIEVARALLDKRIHLAFQPVVAIQSGVRCAFFEALVRLGFPDEEPVSAGRFMPLLESSALGEALDCTVLRLAIDALRHNPTLRLSVNVGARALASDEWMAILRHAHDEDAMLGFRLIVEVTERMALDDVDLAARFCETVRGLGCATALDDFGAGATALRHLQEMRFDILKIDGMFMLGLAGSNSNQVLIRALVRLARHFEMLTVAEFAEKQEDINIAHRLGVDLFQGRRFGMPVSHRIPDGADIAQVIRPALVHA